MARRAASDLKGMGQWVRSLGEQIGNELGRVIADSVNRHLASAINVKEVATRAGAGGRRGRKGGGAKAACGEPGCGNPVLAKGLCRSHYYRERYRSQKAGGRGKRAGKADAGGKKKRGRKAGKEPAPAPAAAETSAG